MVSFQKGSLVGAEGFLTDDTIRRLALEEQMIVPFVDYSQKAKQKEQGLIDWGLASSGYDCSLGTQFMRYPAGLERIDPKTIRADQMESFTRSEPFELEPGGFLLASTRERFRIPNDVMGLCISRSTYARCLGGATMVSLGDGTQISLLDAYNKQVSINAARQTAYEAAVNAAKESAAAATLEAQAVNPQAPIVQPAVVAAPVPYTFQGLSYDTGSRKFCTTSLGSVQMTGTQKVVELTFSDGSVLYPTADHDFMVSNGSAGVAYVQAQYLEPTHELIQFRYHGCEKYTVKSIRPVTSMMPTFCLTSPMLGNFLVGSGFVVKNCAMIVNVTPLVPGFDGEVTLEITNTSQHPVRLYPGEGICQFIFMRASQTCGQSYAQLGGKYMHQVGTVPPRHTT